MTTSDTKIAAMREGGKKLGVILDELLALATPGITPQEIESVAQDRITQAGGTPSFQTVDGYEWATCQCVNDAVVHGIPTDTPLVAGDILTIDVGMVYDRFHTDTAWTKIIGEAKEEDTKKFLEVGEKAMWDGIKEARTGNRVGHISRATGRIIEEAGYHIIPSLVGHGIGASLHEDPQIPGKLMEPLKKTRGLEEGMTLAIEVIYAHGGADIVTDEDGWTTRTRDGSLTAVFEKTIAVTKKGPIVLTPSSGKKKE